MILLMLLLVACTTPRSRQVAVIDLPPVCPAPRALPAAALGAVDALPEHLHRIPEGLDPEQQAAALHAVGIADAALYERARAAARALADWIRSR